jgi:ketosteroid isomerase-like protein
MYRLFALLGVCLLASCTSSDGGARADQASIPDQAVDADQAKSSIAAVIASYDSAVVAGDTTRALSYLHPELVVYEHGHVEGSRAEFAKNHLPADIEFMRSATMARGERAVHVSSGGDLAWTVAPYKLGGQYKGEKVNSAGTETLVLLQTDAGWKIRHAHYSGHKVEAGK